MIIKLDSISQSLLNQGKIYGLSRDSYILNNDIEKENYFTVCENSDVVCTFIHISLSASGIVKHAILFSKCDFCDED